MTEKQSLSINGMEIISFIKGNRREYKTVPGDFLLSEHVVEKHEKIGRMTVRENDVWVVTPPKCGTTWMQEIVWCIANEMDLETAKSLPQFYRFPFFNACFSSTFRIDIDENGDRSCSLFGRKVEGYGKDLNSMEKTPENLQFYLANSFEYTETLPSPRFIKSHLPLCILPNDLHKSKVIYVGRNIKDVCVSTYYQKRSPATFHEHAKAFKNGDVMIGNWFEHMKLAWDRRDEPNFKFVWYEDMKEDISRVIRDIALFLRKNMSQDDINNLADHVSLDSFRGNKMVNKYHEMGQKENFIRKGIVGDWKNHFDDVTNLEWNEWIESELKRTGLKMRGWK